MTIKGERMFNPDGTARRSELRIVNLRRNSRTNRMGWEEVMVVWRPVLYCVQVGSWNTETGLDIKDIVWPADSHVPPQVSSSLLRCIPYDLVTFQGVPEQFSIKANIHHCLKIMYLCTDSG